jgi:capsule polysaccharide export protein KpsE/RkpR
MSESGLALMIPVLAIFCGILGIIGHHVSNYFRLKYGYAPLNQHGKSDTGVSKDVQQQLTSLKADVDRLKAVEVDVERLKTRIATLEKIATDPSRRLEDEIARL